MQSLSRDMTSLLHASKCSPLLLSSYDSVLQRLEKLEDMMMTLGVLLPLISCRCGRIVDIPSAALQQHQQQQQQLETAFSAPFEAQVAVPSVEEVAAMLKHKGGRQLLERRLSALSLEKAWLVRKVREMMFVFERRKGEGWREDKRRKNDTSRDNRAG